MKQRKYYMMSIVILCGITVFSVFATNSEEIINEYPNIELKTQKLDNHVYVIASSRVFIINTRTRGTFIKSSKSVKLAQGIGVGIVHHPDCPCTLIKKD